MDKKTIDFEIQFYEGVIKHSPNYIDALIPLAEMYTRKGLYKKGLEIDRRLASLCKKDPVIHYNLACSLALVGRKKAAVDALRKAVSLGYHEFSHLRKDLDLKSLQTYEPFKKLLMEVSILDK